MSVATSGGGGSGPVVKTGVDRWGAVQTPLSAREDRASMEECTGKWQRIYSLFGASGENARDEVFAAVQNYFWVNGCSPSGKYAKEVKTAGGVSCAVSDVIKITGKLDGEIRQFLRGRMKDSYECLKHSGFSKRDEVMRAKAEDKGVPRDMCYLLADWLKDCEYLTAEEATIYAKLSVKNIAEANVRYAAAGRPNTTVVESLVTADTPEGYGVVPSADSGRSNGGFRGAAY